jgi:hypothetical protein
MKMRLIAHEKVRSFGRSGFSGYIPWKWRQNCKHTCLDHSKNAQLPICVGEDSGHEVECAENTCQTCLTLERAYLQIASDCGRRTPTLGQYSRVCELRTADQVPSYTWQNLLYATALPFDGLHLEMGLHVDSFHGEFRTQSIQRTLSTTHTHVNYPTPHVD